MLSLLHLFAGAKEEQSDDTTTTGEALPSTTNLLPAEVSRASSSQADQPEITVPTLVPGMVAASPPHLDAGTSASDPKSAGRSPETLDWHSCESSDSMEAAHLRVQRPQNSRVLDFVDTPQSTETTTSPLMLSVSCHFALTESWF